MKADWIIMILICFITMSGFWMLLVPAVEVQQVHFGSNVTLGCNISYLYDTTTWLKQNPDLIPTMVLHTSLREGRPVELFQLSLRHSASLMNRSLALKITGVEVGDLGLYYCIANMNGRVVIGKGTRIQNSSQFLFQHWYSAAVCSGLLIMILTVCVTHWKTRQRKRKTTNRNYSKQPTKVPNDATVRRVFTLQSFN
ncbi:uncharacterized protein LOC122829505 [Gambusia affinis]|uniref:uncharacterized protein LOC122829505 n=1 Tax=Gambusia affinis TaxID=33528 RepID=UPI001CDB6644|nr:uncharacterized protein LOC122829505 [Gambusia affinis]